MFSIHTISSVMLGDFTESLVILKTMQGYKKVVDIENKQI